MTETGILRKMLAEWPGPEKEVSYFLSLNDEKYL